MSPIAPIRYNSVSWCLVSEKRKAKRKKQPPKDPARAARQKAYRERVDLGVILLALPVNRELLDFLTHPRVAAIRDEQLARLPQETVAQHHSRLGGLVGAWLLRLARSRA
jgi:hypothetical protein